MHWSWPDVNKGWYGGSFARSFSFSFVDIDATESFISTGSMPSIGDAAGGVP